MSIHEARRIWEAQEAAERLRLDPIGRAAYLASAGSQRPQALPWERLPEVQREDWRRVADALAGTTPAWRRGMSEAYQDRCEGVPFRRTAEGAPPYIDDADRAQWIAGYRESTRLMYPDDYVRLLDSVAP